MDRRRLLAVTAPDAKAMIEKSGRVVRPNGMTADG